MKELEISAQAKYMLSWDERWAQQHIMLHQYVDRFIIPKQHFPDIFT